MPRPPLEAVHLHDKRNSLAILFYNLRLRPDLFQYLICLTEIFLRDQSDVFVVIYNFLP